MTRTARRCLLLAGTFAIAFAAHAGEGDRISPDRPDFLSGPDTVGKGRVQIELGALVERQDGDDSRTRRVSTPTLLRLGISDTLELNVETDGRLRERETTLSSGTTVYETGWADTGLGVKWQMQKGGGGSPAIGWILRAETPSGSRAFRGRGVRPSLVGAFEWDLAGDIELTVNAGVKADSDDNRSRYVAGILGVGFVKELTDRLTVGGEVVARQLASGRHGGNDVVADVLVAWLVSRSLQVDAIVGRGLTQDSPRYFFGTGFTARF